MDIIVFEEATYWRMQKELMGMFSEALKRAKMEAARDDEWVTADEAKIILGYRSKRKWQQLRDSGKIKYSKYGKILKYQKKSLYDYIENNRAK